MALNGPVYHPQCYEVQFDLPRGATRPHTEKVTMHALDYAVREASVPYCAGCGRPIGYGSRYTSRALMRGRSQHAAP